MRKLLNYKSLGILLIICLIVSNVYLQIKVDKAISAAENAEYQARRAFSEAQDASMYASDASDYAQEAASNAENAYDAAEKASRNSFGNQCWSCP
jgi:uncharacterized membrane protein YcjF (UPF0283 family)